MQDYFRDVTVEDLQALLPSYPSLDEDEHLRVPYLGREPEPRTEKTRAKAAAVQKIVARAKEDKDALNEDPSEVTTA